MPHIEAFRGVRYDLGHVGSLGDVVAPPYDVIGTDEQAALYKRHPANVVRLILNRDEPGDAPQDRYARAARFLKNWLREGVLFTESDPAVYVYHQTYSDGGRSYTRRGFLCRVRLERFGEGTIFPHEETHSGPKADRLRLFTACRANLSPIFGLYPDPECGAQEMLERPVAGSIPLEATDDLGVVHRMWPVTDIELIGRLQAAMADKPVYIADGHHRYETSCNYRDQVLEAEPSLDAGHPARFTLMMCVGMNDPGMLVLPTHRLFRGLPELTSDQLIARLGPAFDVEPAGEGLEAAGPLWDAIEAEGEQGTLGIHTGADGKWLVARITEAGRKRMAELAAGHGHDWQGLGVSILHRLIVADLLEAADPPSPMYVHSVEEVVEGLRKGDAAGRDATGQQGTGGKFPLAALVMPATLDHIRAISATGERMPAKSTYFYPKLLSGLVINPLA